MAGFANPNWDQTPGPSTYFIGKCGLNSLRTAALNAESKDHRRRPARWAWLNSTVLGIGLASLFSDWSHEIATTLMPAFLATMGASAAWLGLIEGVADGLSSFAKMTSG